MLEYKAYRYIIPPFVLATLLGVAVIFSPEPLYLPTWVTQFIQTSNVLLVVTALLSAVILILAVGFIIATIPVFVLRILSFSLRKPRGFSMYWTKEAKEKLKKIYTIRNFNIESELCEQVFISEFASEHLRGWMRSRWEYYWINLNCACSSFLAMVLVPLLPNPPAWWWAITSVLLIMFLYNGVQAWFEVRDMDLFLLHNFERVGRSRTNDLSGGVQSGSDSKQG